ncbi:uncharacterized protein LOC110989820 [Acanthaster planci]|uniref:Uncharacterized protein LOC110989820 n=1 Tax=Acanthaster planci TaxID=133434 RepID=A0A8B7ZX88_ACAPL|nr:uncharacterized protein LOC110989820 [Acanthaster planci]
MRHQKSWTDVVAWMGKLFPDYPSSKCRHLVETTVNRVLRHESASRQDFYKEPVDLNFIGPMCAAADITRKTFNQPPVLRSSPLTRGILLELGSCYGGDCFSAICHIYGGKYNRRTVSTELKRTKTVYTKLNKSKSRSNSAHTFLSEAVSPDIDEQAGTSRSSSGTKSSSNSSVHVSSTENVVKESVKPTATTCKLEKLTRKTDSKLKDQSAEIKTLQEKEAVLTDLCREKSEHIRHLENLQGALKKTVDHKSAKVAKLENQMEVLKTQLHEKSEMITRLKSTTLYQKLRRRNHYISQKEKRIKLEAKKEEDMRKKVKRLQQKCRVQKKR